MRTVELNRNLKKEVIESMYNLWGFNPIQKDVIIISSGVDSIVVAVKHVVYHYYRHEKKFRMYEIVPYFKTVYADILSELYCELPNIKTWDEGVVWIWQEKTRLENQNSETQANTLQ